MITYTQVRDEKKEEKEKAGVCSSRSHPPPPLSDPRVNCSNTIQLVETLVQNGTAGESIAAAE